VQDRARRTLAVVLFGANVAAATTVRIGGVGAAMGMLPQLFAAFERIDATKLEVVPSLGTSGGLRALSEGALDIAVAGRALTPDELARGLIPAVAVRTPYGFVTSHPTPNGLKSSEAAGIFKAAKPTWADGSPMRIILRPKSDSDTGLLGGMFPDMAAAIEQARKRPDLSIAATDQDNAELAERVPGSLTGSTLTQIKTERRNLRFVPIDGAMPSLVNVERGIYPCSKILMFVLPAKKNADAERFIAFLQSAAGTGGTARHGERVDGELR
jgi:phosphate transport system substrate-binding protein